jgi:S1-C subfamily serine protease
MQPSSPYRPRVSRETRLLLTTGVLAVAALWLLARIRFQDLPTTPNPVPSVLSQLANTAKFDDLAADVAQLQAQLRPSLHALGPLSYRTASVWLRDDLVVTWQPPSIASGEPIDGRLVVRDPASGLTVVRVTSETLGVPPVAWAPRRLQQPRYFVATEVSRQGVSLRPVFVGSLQPVETPLWGDPVWTVPPSSDLAAGSFVFTDAAELVGLVIASEGELVVVPGATVLAEAIRMVDNPRGSSATLGINVQALTADVAAATGAPLGVVVSWVDRAGAGAGQVMVGDVIEAIDARPLQSRQQWDVRMARLSEGETLALRIRRHGQIRDIWIVALAPAVRPSTRSLGLTMRLRPNRGTEVVRVDRGSIAERAGLIPGDVITHVANLEAPTPAQITRAHSATAVGQRLLIAVTRGDDHHVTTLER